MKRSRKMLQHNKMAIVLILFVIINIFSYNSIYASNDPCNPKMSVQQCVNAIKKEQGELKVTENKKSEKELDIYAKSIMADKSELPFWYIQFNLDTFYMPEGNLDGNILNVLSNLSLFSAKLIVFVLNMISFGFYFITMFIVNFVNGNIINELILGIGKYINNDILNINSNNGLAVKIMFVIIIITLVRSMASRDGNTRDIKSFLKYFISLVFVGMFALYMARANIQVNKTINSITKPIISSLVNDEKLAQNDIKGATLEQKLKNVIYENISLSQFAFQNFGTTTNNVNKEEMRKLMTEKNYADVLAKDEKKPNVYVLSAENKDKGVQYYAAISSILRLANTITGSFFQIMLQTYQLTFNVLSQLLPIFSFLYIVFNLKRGFQAITQYFVTVFLWIIAAGVVAFIILLLNYIISYMYNQFFGINYFATLLFSIFMFVCANWLRKNRKMIFGLMKKLVKGQFELAKSAVSGQPILESINNNIGDPLKEVGNDLKKHFMPNKSEVSGEVNLKTEEDDTTINPTTSNTTSEEDEANPEDITDEVSNDEAEDGESGASNDKNNGSSGNEESTDVVENDQVEESVSDEIQDTSNGINDIDSDIDINDIQDEISTQNDLIDCDSDSSSNENNNNHTDNKDNDFDSKKSYYNDVDTSLLEQENEEVSHDL